LVDSSVWIDHFRYQNADLADLLQRGLVMTHSLVIGELMCGQLPKRAQTLQTLSDLPQVLAAPDHIVQQAIEGNRWFGKGISWIDAHLLVAARVEGIPLWTMDKALQRLAGGPATWVH
jgi:hypothetical protein